MKIIYMEQTLTRMVDKEAMTALILKGIVKSTEETGVYLLIEETE